MGIRIHRPRQRRGISNTKSKEDVPTKITRAGNPVSSWAVGMTVAPRQRPTHEVTIDSFLEAGWDSLHIFAEPDVKIGKQHSTLPITQREKKLGAWKNWYLTLQNLIEFYPDADCYGIIQDDVVFCRGLRKFLEATLWPAEDVGVCSVFTPSHYTKEHAGWYKNNRGGTLWMAQTYFFPPASARNCIDHPRCKNWKKDKQIDNVVGFWARAAKLYPYYFSPSRIPLHTLHPYGCTLLASQLADSPILKKVKLRRKKPLHSKDTLF